MSDANIDIGCQTEAIAQAWISDLLMINIFKPAKSKLIHSGNTYYSGLRVRAHTNTHHRYYQQSYHSVRYQAR